MKRLFLLLALVGMVAVGCTEQPGGENEIPDDAYITLNKEVLTFVPDGESVEVKVYCNYEWTLTNNCDWVTASISGGEASEEGTTITLTANLTYDNREGTIIFNCGKAQKVLVVSQGLKEVIIADENNTFNLPIEGGTVDIAYQTTVECEVVIPSDAQHWISLAPETRGLESGCATLNIAKSNVGADRRAVVKVVKMGDQSVFAEYTITQERNMDYIILYTTTNGETIEPKNFDYLTNTYEDGVGMLAFDGSKVTSIGSYAFNACTSLTSVIIGNGVTEIGDWAFQDCNSLTSTTIPDSVTSIGKNAFSGCTGELIVNCNILSASSYYYGAFYGSRFTRVTIGDSVTSIGGCAFYDCNSLTSVTIGNGVTSIGSGAFYGCTGELIVNCNIPSASMSVYGAFYGSKFTQVTIGDSVTSIGDDAFVECDSLTSVTIGNGVTSIGYGAFSFCNSLTSVYITDIAAWCNISFGDSDSNPLSYAGNLYLNNELVTDLIIPDSVTSIGDVAFLNCDSLTSVTIGNGVTSIGDRAFYDCTSLTSVTIGNGMTEIEDYTFYNCTSLTSVTIPDSVTSIGSYAFSDCDSLTSVTIGNGVTEIGEQAFYKCTSLTSVTIPDSVTSIGDYAFFWCTSLTSVYITDIAAWCNISFGNSDSNPLSYAGNLYLNNELVTDLIIPDSVTSIRDYAFNYCTSLTSVTIPDSVTSIGERAFRRCTSLKEVYCKPTTPPTGGSQMFDYNASGRTIYVPRNSVSAYKSASGWSSYASDIVGYDF